MASRAYVRTVLIALYATYFLVFIGGLVRVAGAGLGCPDWPRCYGGWLPPLSPAHLQQILANTPHPAGALAQADPAHFNFALVWIEYANRLVGVIVGLCTLAVAAVAWRTRREVRGVLAGSLAAVALVVFQGWLGGQVVKSELHPELVSLHLGVALLMVSLLICLACRGAGIARAAGGRWPNARRLAMGLWIAGLVQIALGAFLRGTFEQLLASQPLLSDAELFQQVGMLKYTHIGLGIVLAGASVALSARLILARVGGLARSAAIGLLALSVLQTVAGLTFHQIGLAPILQVFHLWLGSLWLGCLFFLALTVAADDAPAGEPTAVRLGAWLWGGVGVVLAAALLGMGVTELAEQSRRQLQIVGQAPAMSLEEVGGGSFGEDEFKDRITVLTFMFTRCPAICPRMNARMAEFYRLYAHDDRVQLVSISVDPAYDTAETLAEYARAFGVTDHRWRFLRTDDLGVLRTIAEQGFLVRSDFPNHSTKLILIDPEGRIRDYYDYTSTGAMDALKTHIRQLAEEYFLR